MKKWLFLAALVLFGPFAQAWDFGDWFLNPGVGVGYNTAQGTVFRFSLDLGYNFTPHIYGGVGGEYALGKYADHDREIGGGPFVGAHAALTDFLGVWIREDVDYVDVRVPIFTGNPPEDTDYSTVYGIESATTLGVHLSFSSGFGLFGGYRLAVGLSNQDISRDRSGPFVGVAIGF